ncbi:MAG: M20 family peptidase [Sarcina sp.]
MKQDAISYLSTEKENLYELAKSILDFAEESYKEYNTSTYICNFLESHNFKIEKNFQNINTAFKATFGSGHPVICFTCEYDAVEDKGHLTGHNILCSIQLGAAIALSSVLPKIQKELNCEGTIVVLGCPGEYLGGSKETFLRQSVFKEIDAVLSIQPNIINCEQKTTSAVIPLSLTFKSDYKLSFTSDCSFNSLDATLLLCNILKILEKGINCNGSKIDYVICENTKDPFIKAHNSVIKILIRSCTMEDAKKIEEQIKRVAEFTATLLNITVESNLYQPPSEPLNSNQTLARIFSHNLKESGITNIADCIKSYDGISLGGVSLKVPTISHLISIIGDDTNIAYGSLDFAKATLTPQANEIAFKTSCALACTAIDLLEAPHLLAEAKLQLHETCNCDELY